jgi:hypothetical protein
MKTDLEARRRELLRELTGVNREIARTKKRLARLEAQIAVATRAKDRAA